MSRMIAVGNWALGKLARGPYVDAVAGDLAEGVRSGRSAGWYWGQVVAAIGAAWTRSLGARRGTVVFSILWSLSLRVCFLFWLFGKGIPSRQVYSTLEKVTGRLFFFTWSVPWPYSGMLDFLSKQRMDIGFVWVGLLVYLTVNRKGWQESSARRLFAGLMVSFCVGLPVEFANWLIIGIERGHAMGDLYWNVASLCMEISMAVSLYCGIVAARPKRASSLEARA